MKREYGIGTFCYETIRRPNSAGGKDCADVTYLFSKGQTFEVTSAALNEKVLSSNLQINIHSPLLSLLIRVRQVTRICRNFTFFLSSSSLFLWECFT